MSTKIPSARLNATLDLVDGLVSAAYDSAKALARTVRRHTRVARGATLRPGPATPLWNALAEEARLLCRHHGDKANLARYLGLPKQRVHEFLRARSAGPDAERTLLLLVWVQARRRGGKRA